MKKEAENDIHSQGFKPKQVNEGKILLLFFFHLLLILFLDYRQLKYLDFVAIYFTILPSNPAQALVCGLWRVVSNEVEGSLLDIEF